MLSAPREEVETHHTAGLRVEQGAVHVLAAFDVAPYIDLAECERRVMASTDRQQITRKRRALEYFEYRPAPLRIAHGTETIDVGRHRSLPAVDLVVYDFGAISVAYTIPFQGDLAELAVLSAGIYDSRLLPQAARRVVESVIGVLADSASGYRIAEVVEDYVIFHVRDFDRPVTNEELASCHAEAIARILRAEEGPLSTQEVEDATSHRIAFTDSDLAVMDWNATLLYGHDVEDLRTVIEFANVQLLEMRFLDRQLDDALEESYGLVSRRRQPFRSLLHSYRKDARRIARLQVDAAILFERVTNALKVFGEEYLARIYRLTAERLHLAAWDLSTIRKLGTLDSIYAKLSDEAAARRLEILEWIIVALIAASIALPFLA
ncbi:MAG: hypothetical protein JSV86_14020 [Gemmatimonadota bacterium]|nr:MAG: hypothetical protein JSV86_14020 [Gemmatimonadota bacterium]